MTSCTPALVLRRPARKGRRGRDLRLLDLRSIQFLEKGGMDDAVGRGFVRGCRGGEGLITATAAGSCRGDEQATAAPRRRLGHPACVWGVRLETVVLWAVEEGSPASLRR